MLQRKPYFGKMNPLKLLTIRESKLTKNKQNKGHFFFNNFGSHCFSGLIINHFFLNLSVTSQPKDIQFTVIEEQRNQKIFTFKKLKSENLDFFS